MNCYGACCFDALNTVGWTSGGNLTEGEWKVWTLQMCSGVEGRNRRVMCSFQRSQLDDNYKMRSEGVAAESAKMQEDEEGEREPRGTVAGETKKKLRLRS